MVSGSELGLDLVEELELLEPTGLGNPAPRLLVPGGRLADLRPMGEGRHARFKVVSGGARTPAVAFGCDGRLRELAGEPVDASFRLERNAGTGRSSRAWCCARLACAPAAIEVLGRAERVSRCGARRVERSDSTARVRGGRRARARTVLDRRGQSPLAVLGGCARGRRAVLAVCTDVARRLGGLRARIGGFSLASYYALELDPALAGGFEHLVALDPPGCPEHGRLIRCGRGFHPPGLGGG